MNEINNQTIHVVVGIFVDQQNRVLVSKRKKGAHLASMLEFPGGKLEQDESPRQALTREMHEELAIETDSVSSLIQVPYSYQDRKIFLDVFKIDHYQGQIMAAEQQELQWIKISKLNTEKFPAANLGIIRALQLPQIIAITPEVENSIKDFLNSFESMLKSQRYNLVQLRCHEINDIDYLQLAKECLSLCEANGSGLILNRELDVLNKVDAYGVHLTSNRLADLKRLKADRHYRVGASCHSLHEIEIASDLGLDYAFLGPIIEKPGPLQAKPLGWLQAQQIIQKSRIPVYGIGGLQLNDIDQAISCGAQGIASIRSFWPSSSPAS